jgi:hypothetical protein
VAKSNGYREATKLIKETRRKKKQDKRARKATTTMTTIGS